MPIQTATNVKCTECLSKLCKLREHDGILYVEIKHKLRAQVLTKEAIITCVCGAKYHVDAETQTIEEIT